MHCCVCLEEYSGDASLRRRPKLLPCGHSVCENCLQQLHALNNQVIRCPMCKTDHRVNPNSLPVVYDLIQDSTTTHKCSEGDTCGNSAYIKCPHCHKWFCGGHFKDHQEDIFDFCSVNFMEAKDQQQQNKTLLLKLLEVSKRRYGMVSKFILDFQNLCSDYKKITEALEMMLKTLSEDEAENEVLVNEFTFLVESREDVEKTWTQWKEVEALPQMLMDVEVPVADVEALNEKLNDLLSAAAASMTAHVDVETISRLPRSYRRFGEVDSKFVQLRETPVRIASLNKKPWDVAVVKDTRGFSLQSEVIVRGSLGSPLPSPALLVKWFDTKNHLLVCDENGQVRGKIQLKYESPFIQSMEMTQHGNDLINTDFNNKCVMKLSLSGDVITTSQPGVFSDPRGLCCLSDERVAVCDWELKSVQILSQADLSLITSLQHPHITNAFAVTANSSHLIVTNYQANARLLFFSLSDFSFVKLGDEELNEPIKLLHYKGNIFISTIDHKVIQMSESGTPISTVGSQGYGDSQFKYPSGLVIICSRNGDESLVVADCWNSRLKFYKL